MKPNRRQILTAAAATLLQAETSSLEADTVKRHDAYVARLLEAQITDSTSPYHGGLANAYGLHEPASASALVDAYTAAYLHPSSKFHHNRLMIERLQSAASFFARNQSADGNIDNLVTNFNSPPDTAFSLLNFTTAAWLARKSQNAEIEKILQPVIHKATAALVKGGVHTPNHRWVVCSALAKIHELYPDQRILRRIDQWLAEGIDIDEDGQYDERSLVVYNPIVNRSLIIIAAKLKRPELLDPVRKNLDSALLLMHPNYEMVTEISRRQDRNQRGEIGAYYFAMHYLAAHDGNGQYAAIAAKYAPTHAGLSVLMEYPELLKPLPSAAPLPTNYEKHMRALDLVRIRRGDTSATLLLKGDSRFFILRQGDAVIQAVRFASAFFGKGQFIPQTWGREGKAYILKQSLQGPYFQPLNPPHRVGAMEWDQYRPDRMRSEIGHIEQSASIIEQPNGFRVRLQAHGTKGVPLAVEISLRGQEGLQLDGLHRAPGVTDGFILPAGFATVRSGKHVIRFGPGLQGNLYTQVRGAEEKHPGASIYLTGFTPFDHTLTFDVS